MQYRQGPVLVIYFHLAVLICVANAIYETERRFSSSINNFEKLRTFAGVSIAECEEECFKRKRCKGVLYNRRALVCTLTLRQRSDQTIIEDRGTVFSTGFYRVRKEVQDVCSTANCTFTETCVLGDNGGRCETTEFSTVGMKSKDGIQIKNFKLKKICTTGSVEQGSILSNVTYDVYTSECGPPPSMYTSYLGNMYSVNNKIKVLWESTYSKIICGSNGLWRGDNTQCLPGWREFNTSCFYLDTSVGRNYFEAKAFCENVVPNTYLPTIKSSDKDVFVKDWLSSKGPEGVWLGARSDGSNNVYYWRDGTTVSDTYDSWGHMEPNLVAETCVAAWGRRQYFWVDVGCTRQINTLCEYVNPEP